MPLLQPSLGPASPQLTQMMGGGGGTAPPPGPQQVSHPTQNAGLAVAGLSYVKTAVDILTMALSKGLGPETEPGRDVRQAITRLAKHVPPGSTSPAVESQALMELMMKRRAEAPQAQAMRAQQPGVAPQGQGGPQGGPPAPMPGMSRAA